MAGERSAEEIQRDIEQARAALATAVDQLTYRTNPKRLTDRAKASLKQKAATPEGKAVIAGATVLLTVLIIRRVKHR